MNPEPLYFGFFLEDLIAIGLRAGGILIVFLGALFVYNPLFNAKRPIDKESYMAFIREDVPPRLRRMGIMLLIIIFVVWVGLWILDSPSAASS